MERATKKKQKKGQAIICQGHTLALIKDSDIFGLGRLNMHQIFFFTLKVDDLSPVSMHKTRTFKGGQKGTYNGR